MPPIDLVDFIGSGRDISGQWPLPSSRQSSSASTIALEHEMKNLKISMPVSLVPESSGSPVYPYSTTSNNSDKVELSPNSSPSNSSDSSVSSDDNGRKKVRMCDAAKTGKRVQNSGPFTFKYRGEKKLV